MPVLRIFFLLIWKLEITVLYGREVLSLQRFQNLHLLKRDGHILIRQMAVLIFMMEHNGPCSQDQVKKEKTELMVLTVKMVEMELMEQMEKTESQLPGLAKKLLLLKIQNYTMLTIILLMDVLIFGMVMNGIFFLKPVQKVLMAKTEKMERMVVTA